MHSCFHKHFVTMGRNNLSVLKPYVLDANLTTLTGKNIPNFSPLF